MRFGNVVVGLLGLSLSLPAIAQDASKAEAAKADAPSKEDSPEEIAKDAARDLKDNRFYNRPGATRAQYDADWQECRLIARGSRTPAGVMPTYYNPAVVSPLAGAIGGGIGAAIAAAIAEGVQRRANRRNCLLIKGWRLVEVGDADRARMDAMSDADKNAHFDRVVGAQSVEGESRPAAVAESPVTQTARQWLALVDAGRWQDSFAATARSFQTLNTLAMWQSASEDGRVPLGRVLTRGLRTEESIPAPPNGYQLVRFRTDFANKPAATETLSLAREGDGWRVAGYIIE